MLIDSLSFVILNLSCELYPVFWIHPVNFTENRFCKRNNFLSFRYFLKQNENQLKSKVCWWAQTNAAHDACTKFDFCSLISETEEIYACSFIECKWQFDYFTWCYWFQTRFGALLKKMLISRQTVGLSVRAYFVGETQHYAAQMM